MGAGGHDVPLIVAAALPLQRTLIANNTLPACYRYAAQMQSLDAGMQSICNQFVDPLLPCASTLQLYAEPAIHCVNPFCSKCLPCLLCLQYWVCAAIQVSVTVRLPCLGMRALHGTSGHHARFVSLFCCLPARHGIGGDGFSWWRVSPSLSHYPDSRVAPEWRATRRSLRRAADEPRCTVQTM